MNRWFTHDHFLPKDIEHDPFWQKLPDNGKKFLHFIYAHSWLTKKSPHRRYARHTDNQIATVIGVSVRQVQRYRKYCLDHALLFLVTPGNSGTTSKTGKPTAPVYEVPASAGMVFWWRRTRKPWKKESEREGDNREEKGDQTVTEPIDRQGRRPGRLDPPKRVYRDPCARGP